MGISVQEIEAEIAELTPADRDLLLRDLVAGLDGRAAESVEDA